MTLNADLAFMGFDKPFGDCLERDLNFSSLSCNASSAFFRLETSVMIAAKPVIVFAFLRIVGAEYM